MANQTQGHGIRMRDLGPRQRQLLCAVAVQMGVSEPWALKRYAPQPYPREEEIDPEVNPRMLAKHVLDGLL